MAETVRLNMNRVEGDLELEVDVDQGRVVDARCIGTLYRGFEQILLGRDAQDPLAITPRICGICGTAHLYSAVMALEQAFGVPVPANATRIRNLCLMAEEVQSDCRQTFLMFCTDLARPGYASIPGYEDTAQAFAPFAGDIFQEAVVNSRDIIKIVALFGGQWPHSSYMVPGGVTSLFSARRLMESRALLENYIRWFETRILGGSLEQWQQVQTYAQFETWLEEKPQAALSLFSRACRHIGLHRVGMGSHYYLSYGSFPNPQSWSPPYTKRQTLRASGVYDGNLGVVEPFDQSEITEDLSHAWYHETDPTPKHPWKGETLPKYLPESDRYSWSKAPRYNDRVMQTGPLSQLLVDGDPFIRALHGSDKGSAWLRQLSRFQRQADTLLKMRQTLNELQQPDNLNEPYMEPSKIHGDGQGYGLLEAARGSLGHWVKIEQGKISHYQIVTPTAWNASPRDVIGRRGHWEESLLGLPMEDADDPIMLGHVIRSHDPCLVCTVHSVNTGKKYRFTPAGFA
ncbi:nickel-dependent hydrogenase large subunit [Magnetococcus sp. PR-3]|uniref:nickel-dependent hydrogenase large subunit n=1 Tax=Magnetococcus sp. PR-3 TaxID=3120355 RepID=UPI002FCE1688